MKTPLNLSEFGCLIERLYDKYGDYVSFSVSVGYDSRKRADYIKWNIYTPVVSHHDFYFKKDIIEYMKHILEITPTEYHMERINEKIEERNNPAAKGGGTMKCPHYSSYDMAYSGKKDYCSCHGDLPDTVTLPKAFSKEIPIPGGVILPDKPSEGFEEWWDDKMEHNEHSSYQAAKLAWNAALSQKEGKGDPVGKVVDTLPADCIEVVTGCETLGRYCRVCCRATHDITDKDYFSEPQLPAPNEEKVKPDCDTCTVKCDEKEMGLNFAPCKDYKPLPETGISCYNCRHIKESGEPLACLKCVASSEFEPLPETEKVDCRDKRRR